MLSNGFESYQDYFDYVVSLMINNDEDGVSSVMACCNRLFGVDNSRFLGLFCDAVIKKIDIKNQLESYALLRKATLFVDDNSKSELKAKLLSGVSLIEKEKDSPLIKILL